MNISDLNFGHLRLLNALAESGNLTEAGKRIGLTQPGASHALALLRKELQDPLFIRFRDGMRPTPYGLQVVACVRDALRALSTVLGERKDFVPDKSKRRFNVFMSSVGQVEYLPKLLKRLSVEAPGVSLRVVTVPARTPQLMLESGHVDLAVGTFTRLIAGCRQRRLFRERHVCVARRDHPAFRNGMTTDAFRNVPHAVAEQSGYVHELFDRWLARQKIRRVIKFRVPYFLALPMVIARSDFLAIMASRFAGIYAEVLPLTIMPLPMSIPSYDIKLFWHERFHNDPGNHWLRNMFIELFSD